MANEKEIKLTPPEGWEIDEEKSSLKDCKIVYKEKKMETLEDVCSSIDGDYKVEFSGLSERLCSKIDALGELAIVAEYVNEPGSCKSWRISASDSGIAPFPCCDSIGFTSKEAAQRAICILGEDVIRTACQ